MGDPEAVRWFSHNGHVTNSSHLGVFPGHPVICHGARLSPCDVYSRVAFPVARIVVSGAPNGSTVRAHVALGRMSRGVSVRHVRAASRDPRQQEAGASGTHGGGDAGRFRALHQRVRKLYTERQCTYYSGTGGYLGG